MTKLSVITDSLAIIREMRASLLTIYEKKSAFLTEDGTARNAEQEKVREYEKQAIDAFCESILFKIESLSYKLDAIKSFNWDKYHNFEHHLFDTKKTEKTDNDKVRQELQNGKLIILCKDSKTMEYYIFTEIAAFFSNIASIIDNVGYILKYSFRLEIEKEEIKIYDVHKQIQEPLKLLLYEHVIKDYTFGGMRDIRTACEHRALTEVFPFSRMRALGDRDLGPPSILGMPYVNDIGTEISKIKKENRRLDTYCEYLHRKLCDFLDQLVATVIKISYES